MVGPEEDLVHLRLHRRPLPPEHGHATETGPPSATRGTRRSHGKGLLAVVHQAHHQAPIVELGTGVIQHSHQRGRKLLVVDGPDEIGSQRVAKGNRTHIPRLHHKALLKDGQHKRRRQVPKPLHRQHSQPELLLVHTHGLAGDGLAELG